MIRVAFTIGVLFSMNNINAQNNDTGPALEIDKEDTRRNERFGENVRGSNAVTIAVGSSVMNSDLPDPLFEIYFHVGYKRFISRLVNINFTYHKFNLANKDSFNNGFMSFDLNLELNFMPDSSFTPFIFAGGGLHASNYFESTLAKVQGGAGVEYLVLPQLGLKLFADYNQIFNDELDGRVFGNSDDVYWRMGLGVNLYFDGLVRNKRYDENLPTVIESNLIDGNK